MQEQLKQYQDEVEKEVLTNILPFWINNAVDLQNGGFYSSISIDLTINPETPKGAILISRTLWTFSRAYALYQNASYFQIAERAYHYLMDNFIDTEFGGVFWLVDYQCHPLDTKKQIYAQAFAIYGLVEYYAISQQYQALDQAIDLFGYLEKYARDEQYNGYYDACEQDWRLKEDMRLSAKDLNARKSMNTHLHILEAYSNLVKVWPDNALKNKLRDLISIILSHIIDQESWHFKLYFNDEWHPLSDQISYGHDIEGGWLLCEAAQILGEGDILECVREIAINMTQGVYQEGIDSENGVVNEGNYAIGITQFDHDWWPQAEAMVGFLNAYEISHNEIFLTASLNSWEYVKKYFIDYKNGEWYRTVDRNGKVTSEDKVEFWKCPYHNSRACFEVKRRLEAIIESEYQHPNYLPP